ncbi:MAG: putative Histidine kinase [Promethearchaeota archaeon]|nr:MAG: putative Histidine kinase [Candidatus Lokiarchaeota archaeon]
MIELKKFLNSCPLPGFLFQINDREGRCVYSNSNHSSLFNNDKSNYTGKSLKEIGRKFPSIQKNVISCCKNSQFISNELSSDMGDHKKCYRTAYSFFEPNFVILFIQEFKEKSSFENLKEEIREKSKKLERSEKEKAIILKSISQLIAFQDKEHKIIWANKASGDSVGKNSKDLVGKKCHFIWNNSEDPCQYCPVEKCISTGEVISKIQETYDGRVWELKGYPVKDEGGNIIGAVEVGDDITEFTQIQLDLKKAYDTASLYKDILAHDINNILQNLQGSLELSEMTIQTLKNKQKIIEFFNIMKEQILRGKNLVSNVHKLSLIEDSKDSDIDFGKVDLIKYLRDAIVFIRHSFKNGKVIITTNLDDLEQNRIIVHGNELFSNIFENLLLNSIQHNTNKTKLINIILSIFEKDGKDYIKLQIVDNGVGINDKMKKNIFTGNLKLKKESGLGLGLSLVRKIVLMFGGEIWVENRIEDDYTKGSKFNINLPLSES